MTRTKSFTMIIPIVYILSTITSILAAERWSRQISASLIENPEVINDWIPLTSNNQQFARQANFGFSSTLPPPSESGTAAATTISSIGIPSSTQNIDRAGNGRVLSYPHNVFGGGASGNLQSAATQQNQAAYNFVNPFQFQRYQQPNIQKAPQLLPQQQQPQQQQQQQPTSQSFFKFEMPSFSVDGRTQSQPIQTGYQIQHSFGSAPGHSVITSPLFTPQKQLQFPNDYHPQQSHQPQHQQLLQRKPNSESKTKDLKSSTTANHENLIAHHHRPDIYTNSPQSFQKPTSFQSPFQQHVYKPQDSIDPIENIYAPQEPAPVKQPHEEEVQLLYVPYDTLYSPQNEQQVGYNNGKYNLVQQPVNPLQINNFYTQDPLDNRGENYFGAPSSTTTTTSTTTTLRPTTSAPTYRSNTNSNQFLNPKFTTTKPKPKPHQPPLAMFLQKTSSRATSYDIVNILSRDKSVAVLDSPSKNSPQVFIGPSGLQTPLGYTKFELPYLSSFNQNNLDATLKATPFFVAPLSYKTPFGFSKIVLPEPHVGSIVINKPFQTEEISYTRGPSTRRPQRPQTTKEAYSSSPYVSSTQQNRFSSTTPKHVTRFQSTTPYEESLYHQQLPEEKPRVSHAQNDYYNNFYQDAIKEVSSPKTVQKQHHSKTRPPVEQAFTQTIKPRPVERPAEPVYTRTAKPRPSERPAEPVFVERVKSRPVEPAFTQTVKPYAQFKPMPTNIGNDEYFRAPPLSSSSTVLEPETTSTVPPSSKITTTPQPPVTTTPKAYYSETYEPNRYTQSTHGQQYFETSSSRPTQNPDVFHHKFQSKPLFDDEYRMKAYFRQQNANRNRQPTAPDTTVSTRFENVQYTPVSLDYDRPSSTPYFEGSTLRTTTPRVTFYTPSSIPSSYEENEQSNIVQTQNEPINKFNLQQEPETDTQTLRPKTEYIQSTIPTHIPNNHKQNYDNEVTVYNHDDEKSEENVYDKPYNLPSELPPLTPNLPGLVNALKENERLNAIERETTETLTTTTTTTASPRTRRPINRGRRPTARTSTSSSISFSSADDNITRKPINRARRPYAPPTRNNSSVTTSVSSSSSVSTGGTTRTSIIRNPNRVRYNPSNEERKQFRSKTRKQGVSSSKPNRENSVDENNLEYQRDVLKQNYPVFKHPTRKPFFTTTTEKSQEVMTVTPSALGEAFPGLLEPMQIAQQYQHQQFQDNYGPGYFPNEEEINPTEPIRNEIITTTQIPQTSPPTTTTTTTETIRELTKRPSFVRRTRPSRTTTESSITTTTEGNDKYTIRPRRPDGSLPRKVIKVRTRTRRPHPVSSTAAPDRERENLQKVSKFNQDFYNDDYKNNEASYNRRLPARSKFNLDTQETKWSPTLSRSDNFKPLNIKQTEKTVKYDNDQDIVTAGPKKQSDTFEFNVSAGFGPSMKTYGSVIKTEEKQSKTNKKKVVEKTVEPTFEELLEQVMTDLGREVAAKKEAKAAANEATKIIKEESARQLKPSPNDKAKQNNNINSRGGWKKVRVSQTSSSSSDGFETAESQNIGTQLFNTIYNNEKTTTEKPQQSSEELISITKTTTDKSIGKIQPTNIISTTTVSPSISTTNSDISSSTTTTTDDTISSTITSQNLNKIDITSTSTQQPTSSSESNLITTSSTIKPFGDLGDGTTTRFFNQDYEEDDSIGDIISRRFDQQQHNENDDDIVDDDDDDDDIENGNDDTVIDDLDTQPSLFDEVRSQLKNLFAVREDEDDYGDVMKPNFQPRKHEYTTIQRVKPSTTNSPDTELPLVEATTSKDTLFHKNLMKNVVYATSTSKEVSHETEICYRGRCIKSTRN